MIIRLKQTCPAINTVEYSVVDMAIQLLLRSFRLTFSSYYTKVWIILIYLAGECSCLELKVTTDFTPFCAVLQLLDIINSIFD